MLFICFSIVKLQSSHTPTFFTSFEYLMQSFPTNDPPMMVLSFNDFGKNNNLGLFWVDPEISSIRPTYNIADTCRYISGQDIVLKTDRKGFPTVRVIGKRRRIKTAIFKYFRLRPNIYVEEFRPQH